MIAGFAVREGIEAWNGEACCNPVSQLLGGEQARGDDEHCEDGCCGD